MEGGKRAWVPSAGLEEPSTLLGFSLPGGVGFAFVTGAEKQKPHLLGQHLEVVCTDLQPQDLPGWRTAALQRFP